MESTGLFTDFDSAIIAKDIGFFTNASRVESLGFECYYNKQCTFGKWEPGFIKEKEPSIAFLELYALCIGILVWQEKLRNMKILIHRDNAAVVEMVNKTTSKCKNCMYLLCILMLNNLLFK